MPYHACQNLAEYVLSLFAGQRSPMQSSRSSGEHFWMDPGMGFSSRSTMAMGVAEKGKLLDDWVNASSEVKKCVFKGSELDCDFAKS